MKNTPNIRPKWAEPGNKIVVTFAEDLKLERSILLADLGRICLEHGWTLDLLNTGTNAGTIVINVPKPKSHEPTMQDALDFYGFGEYS